MNTFLAKVDWGTTGKWVAIALTVITWAVWAGKLSNTVSTTSDMMKTNSEVQREIDRDQELRLREVERHDAANEERFKAILDKLNELKHQRK